MPACFTACDEPLLNELRGVPGMPSSSRVVWMTADQSQNLPTASFISRGLFVCSWWRQVSSIPQAHRECWNAALAKSTLDDSVRRAYVKLSHKDVSRISVLPFPASLNKSDGTQQLTRSVRSAMTDVLMRCDDRCQEGVRAPTRVPGWIHPLRLAFNRAITPDRCSVFLAP